jgi:hypothetical protein
MLPGKRTNDGALYVTQGPPPAGTPLVGGIAVSHTGVIYVSQSFNPPFTPADLFKLGEQGAWYDPSDLTTMFQDSAGTAPVTADGQPVGLIRDKSGRNNHASQATAAKRPLYKTSGGLHWLQFDGVDDSLSTAANIDFTATDKTSYFVGARKENVTLTYNSLIAFGSGSTGTFELMAPDNVREGVAPWLFDNSRQTISVFTSPAILVISCNQDTAGVLREDETKLRVNASNQTINNTTGTGVAAANFANAVLSIGSRIGGTLPFTGRAYSVIVLGRLATTQEITDTETWVNSKTGAY